MFGDCVSSFSIYPCYQHHSIDACAHQFCLFCFLSSFNLPSISATVALYCCDSFSFCWKWFDAVTFSAHSQVHKFRNSSTIRHSNYNVCHILFFLSHLFAVDRISAIKTSIWDSLFAIFRKKKQKQQQIFLIFHQNTDDFQVRAVYSIDALHRSIHSFSPFVLCVTGGCQ